MGDTTHQTDAAKRALRETAATIDFGSHSEAVASHLRAWPPVHGVVAIYLAMGNEIDIAPVGELSRCRPLVPRTEADGSLTLHWLDGVDLVEHRYGFMEPDAASTPVNLDDVDVVLVPGLGFDKRGNRLGRGAGMYDRLLAALPVGVVRVGVTVDAAVVDEVPISALDQPVDWIVSESGVSPAKRGLGESSQSVVAAAAEVGIAAAMVRFPEGTKTSQDAARAVDAELGSIAKSIVFLVDDEPVLVLCSGDHRIDAKRLADVFGATKARPAPLDRVRDVTGFVAGGTPAVGHATKIRVVADTTLCRYRWVWSAGGTPDTVYPVALDRLIAATGARWVDVSDRG